MVAIKIEKVNGFLVPHVIAGKLPRTLTNFPGQLPDARMTDTGNYLSVLVRLLDFCKQNPGDYSKYRMFLGQDEALFVKESEV